MATKTKQNRAETERQLIDAALGLIQRNGVLAGLNLREVADEAEVSRGNIYHYFGSRQELLRAAITRRFEAAIGPLLAGGTLESMASPPRPNIDTGDAASSHPVRLEPNK